MGGTTSQYFAASNFFHICIKEGGALFFFCWRLVSSIVCLRDTLSPHPKQSKGDIIFIVWKLPQLNVDAMCYGPHVTKSISMRGKEAETET